LPESWSTGFRSTQTSSLDASAGLRAIARPRPLTLAKVINIHEVIALSVFQGLINAFDMPGRQAFLVQMVGDSRTWAMQSH